MPFFVKVEVRSGSDFLSVGLAQMTGNFGPRGRIDCDLEQDLGAYLKEHELREGTYRVGGAVFDYRTGEVRRQTKARL